MTLLETGVVLSRGAHVAALISLFGTLVFVAVMAEAMRCAPRLRNILHYLGRASAACAIFIGFAWLFLESARIADTDSFPATLHALPVVAFQTQYGRWFVLRCVLLVALLLLPFSRRTGLAGALALAGAALAVQPLLGHAGALGGNAGAELIGSEALHLLAAGAWLGGLLPLFLAVGILPREAAARTCLGFTSIGLSAVLLLAGTAVVQVATLIGGLPGLFGTEYGHVGLLKLGCFLVLLALAALNRLVLTGRMARGGVQSRMRLSIALEAVLGVLVVVIASFLASLTPGTHEQPAWPFSWRASLSAFYDPLLRRELIAALVAVAIGVGVAITGVAWRRVRWFAIASALVILIVAIPHLDLLFVAAYPTSFYASPTEFAATAIAHGAKLFAAHCSACHGTDARGSGPAAQALPVPPADLTAEHFWVHSDGDLYWFVSHGFTGPGPGVVMPGFRGTLSSEAIWNLIDYLRAHNAGESMRRTGKWSHPLPVPQFDVECPDGRTIDLDDLRGRMLRIVAASGDDQAEPVSPVASNVTTVFVVRHPSARQNFSACVTREPETWAALAIILGLTPDTVAGAQILVDGNAWLRTAWRPGEPGDWTDPQRLAAELRDVAAHPLAVSRPSAHIHGN
jgi:putative copper export protein/mono/diheme cytochrome c family protein